MQMQRIVIQLPAALKRKLDAMKTKGYTASGYIRAVLEEKLGKVPDVNQKGGKASKSR